MEEAQLDILSRQCDTLIALCRLAREKQRAILSGSIDDLLELVAQEERLAEVLEQNEEERASLPGGALTLQEMEQQFPDSKLLAEGRKMAQLCLELQEINKANEQLLATALAYVDFSLRALMGEGDDKGTYSGQGPGGGAWLDTRA
jgi:flagellar biosynthesis/type III secretory pathway chaperone